MRFFMAGIGTGINLVKKTAAWVQANGAKSIVQTKAVNPNMFGEIKGLGVCSDVFQCNRAANLKISPKELINKVLGANQRVMKDWQDLGGFYSFKTFFSKPTTHYVVIDKQKSTLAKNHITGYVLCNFDKLKKLKNFLFFNANDKSINIYNQFGEKVRYYNPQETKALLTYKANSTSIHKVLRYKKDVKHQEEINEKINILQSIFKKHKTQVATEDMVVYRALDSNALQSIMNMPRDGMVFTEPSFMSVATKKSSTYQFLNLKNFKHIMEIKIPKGTEYINMDDIGHIVVKQMPENELLLGANSNLLIKSRKGMIKAELIK